MGARQFRWYAVATAVALVLLSTVLAKATGFLTPLAVVVFAIATVTHHPRLGWRMATALTLLFAMIGQVLLAWAAPLVPGSLGNNILLVWAAVGLVHAGFLARAFGHDWIGLDRRRLIDLATCLGPSALVGAYFVWTAQRSNYPWMSWAMANDMANNLLLNRSLIEEGGLLVSQGNAAPMATVLSGSWSSIGYDPSNVVDSIKHLVTANAYFGLTGWMLLSALVAALVLRDASTSQGARAAMAFGTGFLPWLWFVSGISTVYGYLNALPTMMILVLAWWCWREGAARPVASLTGLIAATWAAGMAWGPVALLPAAWMAAAVLLHWRQLWRSGRQLLWPASTMLAAAIYVLTVTLRDIGASSSALALDGAHPLVSLRWSVLLAAVALILVLALARWLPAYLWVGTITGVLAATLGVATLARSRIGLTEIWGYYPVKYTWLVFVAGFLIAPAVLQIPARRLGRAWAGNGAVLILVLVVIGMVQVSPPPRPITAAGSITPVSLHDSTPNDFAVFRMFELMEADPHSIVSGYFRENPFADSFANFWLLQMGADDIGDEIRQSAYQMDPTDPAQLCQAAERWDSPVTVWTRNPSLAQQVEQACPKRDIKVRLARELNEVLGRGNSHGEYQ